MYFMIPRFCYFSVTVRIPDENKTSSYIFFVFVSFQSMFINTEMKYEFSDMRFELTDSIKIVKLLSS